MAALSLSSGPTLASELCAADADVQLIKQQLLPGSTVYYRACGMPAASLRAKQIAVSGDDSAVAPSACAMQVCVFDAAKGHRLKRWKLTVAPAGVDLSTYMQPLLESLRSQEFRPMKAIPLVHVRGNVLSEGTAHAAVHRRDGTATVEVHLPGHAPGRLRFQARTMHCESQTDQNVLPQIERIWTLEGMAAVVIAADYMGATQGCSWTEWRVLPLKRTANR